MLQIDQLRQWIAEYLSDTDYELITLTISPENEILVEVDRLRGVDVEFCEALNRHLVGLLDSHGCEDYALEVGSVSLTDPFRTKMQYEKNLGHEVEVLVSMPDESGAMKQQKIHGQLVSVDEDTFSVDVEQRVVVPGKKRKELQVSTLTWRYDEPQYVKYNLKF